MSDLRKGMPVIINDVERPEARLVAVLTTFNARTGIWRARYLANGTHGTQCWTGGQPTPLSHFGIALESDGDRFRCVSSGEPSIATYRDGRPRSWQDRTPSHWWPFRTYARKFLAAEWLQERERADV